MRTDANASDGEDDRSGGFLCYATNEAFVATLMTAALFLL